MTGTVKIIFHDKGYGFITGVNRKDYFFHRKGVFPRLEFDEMEMGDPVEFEDGENDKGLYAEEVRRS